MLLAIDWAACIPAQADALKDRSSMPPVSVTMQAEYAAAALEPLPLGVLSGAFPQAAAASVRPPAARAATIRFPVTGRKTPSFHYIPTPRGESQAGAYAQATAASGNPSGLLAHRYLVAIAPPGQRRFGLLGALNARRTV